MSAVYKHLLVPVDFTEQNQAALQVTAQLASPHETQVTLIHVIETIDYVADEEIEQFYKMLTQRAKVKLDQLCERFREANVKIQGKVIMGKRARGVVTYVMQNGVDLVVLSSHRVNLAEQPKVVGTLSHQVSQLCPCDVLLVKS